MISKIKTKKLILILLSFLLLAAVLTVAIFLFRQDWLFLLKEKAGCGRHAYSVKEAEPKDLQSISILDISLEQSMLLINNDYTLSEDFTAEIREYKGANVSVCMYDSLDSLLSATYEACSEKLYITSSYRTSQQQADILADTGSDKAAQVGASEHEAGLAVDLCEKGFGGMSFLKTKGGRFVSNHAHEYGFIIRYPMDKQDITGIEYEPWHVRYVGLPHSRVMYNNSLTLEEYISSLKIGSFYSMYGYVVSRQKGDTLLIPESYEYLSVSPDNTGCYIVTFKT